MTQIEVVLPNSGDKYPVVIEKKNISTCRLKVYPDRTVKMSLPQSASNEWAESFVNDKADWIETKINNFQKTQGYAATTEIKNGYSIKLLGEDLIFSVTQCKKNNVYREGKIIHICSTDISDQEKLIKIFEMWWRGEAQRILKQRVDEWYPIIRKYNIPYPKITIRKMKTLWGSCSANRNAVSFNFYLIKAKLPEIDYVVLHELVHFLYPNHSKQFYDFLSNYMPDWKERKQKLDQDVVHGL